MRLVLWQPLPWPVWRSSPPELGTLLVTNTASERERHSVSKHLHWELDACLGKWGPARTKVGTLCVVVFACVCARARTRVSLEGAGSVFSQTSSVLADAFVGIDVHLFLCVPCLLVSS